MVAQWPTGRAQALDSTLATRGRACRYMRAPAPWSKLVAKGRLAASGRGAPRASPSALHSRSAAAGQAPSARAASATHPGANSAADTPAHRPAAVRCAAWAVGRLARCWSRARCTRAACQSSAGRHEPRERGRSMQEGGTRGTGKQIASKPRTTRWVASPGADEGPDQRPAARPRRSGDARGRRGAAGRPAAGRLAARTRRRACCCGAARGDVARQPAAAKRAAPEAVDAHVHVVRARPRARARRRRRTRLRAPRRCTARRPRGLLVRSERAGWEASAIGPALRAAPRAA